MKQSWRNQTPNWPEQETDTPNPKVALLGLFTIVWLGFFYAVTIKLGFMLFDSPVEWQKVFIFGVVASFTRGLDRFINRQ